MIPGEVWAALGLLITAGFAYAGVRYQSRQTARAQKTAAMMEEKAIDAAAYERARDSYDAAINVYKSEATRMEERIGQLSSRIIALNEEILQLEESKRAQRYDIEATIDQLVQVRKDYEEHLRWCNQRMQRLRNRLINGEVITDTDPDLQVSVIEE